MVLLEVILLFLENKTHFLSNTAADPAGFFRSCRASVVASQPAPAAPAHSVAGQGRGLAHKPALGYKAHLWASSGPIPSTNWLCMMHLRLLLFYHIPVRKVFFPPGLENIHCSGFCWKKKKKLSRLCTHLSCLILIPVPVGHGSFTALTGLYKWLWRRAGPLPSGQ